MQGWLVVSVWSVSLSELAAVDDGDGLRSATTGTAQGLNLLHHLHAYDCKQIEGNK